MFVKLQLAACSPCYFLNAVDDQLLLLLASIEVQSGVHNDPDDEKPGRRGHEPLLGEFPGPSVLLLVDLLEGGPIGVEDSGVDGGEAYDTGGPGDPEGAPRQADEHAKQLPEPIDHVEEVVLLGPRRVRNEGAAVTKQYFRIFQRRTFVKDDDATHPQMLSSLSVEIA